VAIVVTGGAVRLTASGLGCPTFPRCTDTSLVATREMGLHGAVEFGNRMLTFALSAVVVAAVVVAWRAHRRDLRTAGLVLLGGVVAQALLGGVTVLTGLNPVTVMAHFLVSVALIAIATIAFELSTGQPVPHQRLVHPAVLLGGRGLLGVTALLLLAGTVVTGTGPHSGDRDATDRLPFDLVEVTQLHADLVFLVVGLALGLGAALRGTDAPQPLRRRWAQLMVVLVAQGLVGYLQYATDLPIALVAAHVLGACLVWVAALRLVLGMTTRVAPIGPGERHEELSAPAVRS
jgi:heme a synthase